MGTTGSSSFGRKWRRLSSQQKWLRILQQQLHPTPGQEFGSIWSEPRWLWKQRGRQRPLWHRKKVVVQEASQVRRQGVKGLITARRSSVKMEAEGRWYLHALVQDQCRMLGVQQLRFEG